MSTYSSRLANKTHSPHSPSLTIMELTTLKLFETVCSSMYSYVLNTYLISRHMNWHNQVFLNTDVYLCHTLENVPKVFKIHGLLEIAGLYWEYRASVTCWKLIMTAITFLAHKNLNQRFPHSEIKYSHHGNTPLILKPGWGILSVKS